MGCQEEVGSPQRRNRKSRGGEGFSGLFGQKRRNRGQGGREARVPGAHLLRKGGIASSLGLCVQEELCPNAQGHVQSHAATGEV